MVLVLMRMRDSLAPTHALSHAREHHLGVCVSACLPLSLPVVALTPSLVRACAATSTLCARTPMTPTAQLAGQGATRATTREVEGRVEGLGGRTRVQGRRRERRRRACCAAGPQRQRAGRQTEGQRLRLMVAAV
jgi:hypothetical protein